MEQREIEILIDTDVLIALSNTQKQQHMFVYNAFEQLANKGLAVSISIIGEMEMIQGSKNNVEKNRLIKFLTPFNKRNLTPAIANMARQLIINYSASHGLEIADALIAATALHFDVPLLTFNKKDFRFIAGLNLYEP